MNLLDPKILKDSSTYRMLERRIRLDEMRTFLLDQATDRFGPPSNQQKAVLEGIEDHDRVVRLCKKVGTFSTWDELLAAERVS